MEEMKEGIHIFSETSSQSSSEIIKGVRSIGKGLVNLGLAVKDCDKRLEGRERELFVQLTSYFYTMSMTSAATAVSLNVMVNGVDIYKQLDAAYTSYLAKEYEDFGRDIGAALSLTFVGDTSAAVTYGDTSTLKGMQTAYLYPPLSKGYTVKENKAYIDYLEFISKSRENPADDTLVKPDLSVIKNPKIPEHKEVDEKDLPAYMDGEAYYDFYDSLHPFT